MTCREKFMMTYPKLGNPVDNGCCPEQFDYLAEPINCNARYPDEVRHEMMSCNDCWDREISEENPVKLAVEGKVTMNEARERVGLPPLGEPQTPRILDSGNRRQFESGAVRDIQEGKGRCDLLPLDVVAEFFRSHGDSNSISGKVFDEIAAFQNDGDYKHLLTVLDVGDPFDNLCYCTMLLEVAIHFEEGAKKYGDNNWRKGIPVRCYIDSGVRHYLKFLRGDKDEPHDRAFCWNMLCAIWTAKHKPGLNEYARPMEEPV